MTVSITLPALDPHTYNPATLLLSAPDALPSLYVPPDPEPGDPTVPLPEPVAGDIADTEVLLICEAGTHRKLAEVTSARVESWDDPLSVRNPGQGRATASLYDPCWQIIGAPFTTMDDDLVIDPEHWKQYEILLVDPDTGGRLSAGYLEDVISIGGGQVSLNWTGPAAVFNGTMGAVGTTDLLGGAGSFDAVASGSALAAITALGWDVPLTGMEVRWNTTDPLSGARSLQVKGTGLLRGPEMLVSGSADYRRRLTTAAVVRHRYGRVRMFTEVYRTVSGVEVNAEEMFEDQQETNEDQPDWQGVDSIGTLDLLDTAFVYRATFRLLLTGDTWVDIDEVRYPEDSGTGSRVPQDVAAYPALIVRRMQQLGNPDGQSLGISTYPWQGTGKGITLWWPDDEDVAAIDALGQVMDHRNGVEVSFNAGWRMDSRPRRGNNRYDIRLDNDSVIVVGWETSPQAIVDQLRALLPYTSGPGRMGFAFDTPRPVTQRIHREIVQTPTDLSYKDAETWAGHQHERASRTQRYATLKVSYELGRQIATGDGLQVALHEGSHGWWGWVRVANRTFNRAAGWCDLAVGLDPGVLPDA